MNLSLEALLSILVPLMILVFTLLGLAHSTAIRRIRNLEERFEQKTDDIERNLRHRVENINTSVLAAVTRMDNKRSDDLERLVMSLEESRTMMQQRHHLFKRRSGDRETRGQTNGGDEG